MNNMKSNTVSLNTLNQIDTPLTLSTEINSSLLCQIFMENESATKEELKELSQSYNINLEIVSSSK